MEEPGHCLYALRCGTPLQGSLVQGNRLELIDRLRRKREASTSSINHSTEARSVSKELSDLVVVKHIYDLVLLRLQPCSSAVNLLEFVIREEQKCLSPGWVDALWRRYRDLGATHVRLDDAVWVAIKDLASSATYEGIISFETPEVIRQPGFGIRNNIERNPLFQFIAEESISRTIQIEAVGDDSLQSAFIKNRLQICHYTTSFLYLLELCEMNCYL